MPNPSQSDKDLAFLVLKFGGPSLLNILYRAHVLPHESTAYRMAKMCPPIVSSVQDTVAKCFESNTKISATGRCAVSLKMDETYITPVLSYDQRSNQACGACYQHGCNTKLALDNFGDCENLHMLVESDQLHIPKECLVVGVSSLNENRPMQPFLMWPSYSKKDEAGTIKLINDTNSKMKELHGYPLVNVCTDGDGTRRKVLNSLMTVDMDDVDKFLWVSHISNLSLVDYVAGPDGITGNFDPKHMAKRCWKVTINGIVTTKKLLKEFFLRETQ